MKKKDMRLAKIWREPYYDTKYYGKKIALGIVLIVMIAFLFYHTPWALIPLQLLWIPYWYVCIRSLKEDKQLRYLLQFRDFLQILSGNLQSGQSVENAMEASLKELKEEWGIGSFIYQDVYKVIRQIKISGQYIEAFKMWSELRDSQDLRLFITVFLYGRKTGGDLCYIIKRTTDSISQRANTRQEIQTLLSSKNYEQTIMSVMPLAILMYIRITNEDYLQVLYHNETGFLIMSAALLIYLFAVAWGRKILRIEGIT